MGPPIFKRSVNVVVKGGRANRRRVRPSLLNHTASRRHSSKGIRLKVTFSLPSDADFRPRAVIAGKSNKQMEPRFAASFSERGFAPALAKTRLETDDWK